MTTRMRILVVAPWLPPSPPVHAGGQAVLRHLGALSQEHEVTMVAPSTAESAPSTADVRVVPVPVPAAPAHGLGHVVDYVRWLVAGVGWTTAATRAARLAEETLCSSVGPIDLVEVQYLESLPVGVRLADRLRAPIVLWSHDVVDVELRRQLVHARSPRLRAEALVRLPSALRRERRMLPRCAAAVVFNPDDADRLRRHGLRGPVTTVRPSLDEGPLGVDGASEPVVLAVAAYGRPTNREGLRWLLEQVWPRVRREVPDAELRVVGSNMPPVSGPGVSAVGYVADLGVEYRRARVAVAPVFAGAGLKFRVPQAFSWAVPVVATPLAAEGLRPPDGAGFAGVTESADDFAVALVQMLRSPERAASVGAAGAAWWGRQREEWADEASIASWYRTLETHED